QALVSPTLLSFMSESRRLDNTRLKRELRLRLRYPDVPAALASLGATPVQSSTQNERPA
ncbi:MAG: SDR family NAD(P)-dependent oxidoreductase, partial [Lysobacteraceae bacterium]